jgi:flagellar basal body rod protein FlgG
MVDAVLRDALDRIAQRAADVQAAFTPGAVPRFGDVATAAPQAQRTFDPLCVAAPPGAYFLANDAGRVLYTRDGGFTLRDGVLTGTDGRTILGYTTTQSAPEELRVDAVDATLGRIANPRIEADGTLAYDRVAIDPRSGARTNERVTVGTVALARFPAATTPMPVDASHGVAPLGVVPHTGRPGDGSFAVLMPMARETSRIDFDRSLDRLEEAYVAFDALQAARKARGNTGKTVMDLLK